MAGSRDQYSTSSRTSKSRRSMSADLAQPINEATASDIKVDAGADTGKASPVVSPAGSPDFDIVTGGTPDSRSSRCTARHKAAAAIAVVVAAVVTLLVLMVYSGNSPSAAVALSTAPMAAVQHRQHVTRMESLPSEKTVDVASFTPSDSTFVCMYECTGDEPAHYDPAKVHTVGGCQATPCSAFGQEYCGVWGGQASESFQVSSHELCTRYVEKMKPVPVHQRAAAFHVTIKSRINNAVDAKRTGTSRRALAAPATMSTAELDTCEEIVNLAKDHVRHAAEHEADFVCDADAVCPHFDGDHATQCRKFEQGLHMHFQGTESSLCGWVKDKMEGDNADIEAIPQVMCTQLLSQVVSVVLPTVRMSVCSLLIT